MSRNEDFRWGQVHHLAKWWDPNMGSPESLLEREGPYISKLAASEARNQPITVLKREDGNRTVWDGHHRIVANMFFDSSGNRTKEPQTTLMRWRETTDKDQS